MKKIHLIDYIGVHCGMDYYLESFKKILLTIPYIEINILSNFTDKSGTVPFFVNQYEGNKITKGIALLRNLNRLRTFVRNNPEDVFIYLTYGNSIDLPFMRIIANAKHHIVDIHEAIAQYIDNNRSLKKKFEILYRYRIDTVISHSTRTDDFLNEYKFQSKKLFVPHFKYTFPKGYDRNQISEEIFEAIDLNRINLLFFGNLSESKGVDILLKSVNLIHPDTAEKVNLIIAGKDFDGSVDRVNPYSDRHVKTIRRHINDDELRFLYQNVDYITLPYRKTSQSGILEMAFYFKRPIIASDIPYFRQTMEKFPSFGTLAGNTAESFADSIEKIVKVHGDVEYYKDMDYEKYENRLEVNEFISSFKEWLKNNFS